MRQILFGFLLVICTSIACAGPGRMRVIIGPDEIRQNLEESFPISEDLAIATLALTDPELLLEEGADRIGLRLRVRVTIAPVLAVEGTVAARGKLRYQPEETAFYIDQPEIIELSVPGLPEEHVPDVMAAANLALIGMLPKVPIHRLEEGATRMFLRAMRVEDGQVVAELGI